MGGFFPGKKYGGPPVSIDNFCTLMKEHKCYIVTHNHDLFDNTPYENINNGWNNRGNCKVLYLSDSRYNKKTFEKVIQKIKPDILYLQGLFQACILPSLQLAKKYSIKVLLAPRGELCTGAFNMKKYKKIPYIEYLKIMGLIKNIHFQSTSEEETEAIHKILNCSYERIHRLDNIPSIPKKDYQRREKTPGIGRFIFLGRIHPKKNLLSAIKYFNSVDGEAIFDIYGSIEDETYWQECQAAIKALPMNVKCTYKGLVSHDQVHEVFSQYDAFLFPTLSENYGHVIAESLIVGTPVIISDQTPWNDINNTNAGIAIPLENSHEYIESINTIINNNGDSADSKSKDAFDYINNKTNSKEIWNIYNNTISMITRGEA